MARTKTYCCDPMKAQLELRCDQHTDPFDCPDTLICYSDQNQTHGLIIHDGGGSYVAISYCPWCGSSLEVGRQV